MEQVSTGEKRDLEQMANVKGPEAILTRIDLSEHSSNPNLHSLPLIIHIDKNEFSIGRARDNDEIILDPKVSRRHCIFRCEGNNEWIIKDLSSTCTYINDEMMIPSETVKLKVGDMIQWGVAVDYKYKFTLGENDGHCAKKPRLEDSDLYDTVLTQQKSFAEVQETQKKTLKDQLEIKQKAQEQLKLQLEQLLKQQQSSLEDAEGHKNQISILEAQIESGNAQEQYLQNMYEDLLKKLAEERLEFEAKLNEEKEKWEAALNMTKQEKEILQEKMKQDLEACRLELQTKMTNEIESRVKEVQTQFLNEKSILQQKLKEAEDALKVQRAKAEEALNNGVPAGMPLGNYIFVEVVQDIDGQELPALDTIDLTNLPSTSTSTNLEGHLLDKVNDIMDEQLTCSICSELFIKATTLSCMHTFCRYCIDTWTLKSTECPICRDLVGSKNTSLALDNFIEKMLETLPAMKEKRQDTIKERQALQKRRY